MPDNHALAGEHRRKRILVDLNVPPGPWKAHAAHPRIEFLKDNWPPGFQKQYGRDIICGPSGQRLGEQVAAQPNPLDCLVKLVERN